MTENRVFITGIGAISPFGPDRRSLWEALAAFRPQACRSAHSPIIQPATHRHGGVVAKLIDWDTSKIKYVERAHLNKLTPVAQWALIASTEALEEIGLEKLRKTDLRKSVLSAAELFHPLNLASCAARRSIEPFTPVTIPSLIAMMLKSNGAVLGLSAASNSSLLCLAAAFESIRFGTSDIAVVIAATSLSDVVIHGCNFSQPGKSTKTGSINAQAREVRAQISEGACSIVLESAASVQRRGGHVYAEIGGFGTCYSPGIPEGTPTHAAVAAQHATADAGITSGEIHWIIHTTGDLGKDILEVFLSAALLDTEKIFGVLPNVSGLFGVLAGIFQCRCGRVNASKSTDESLSKDGDSSPCGAVLVSSTTEEGFAVGLILKPFTPYSLRCFA